MSADNLEGPEVDLLIQELSSPARRKAAAKPAVNAPGVPAAPVARAPVVTRSLEPGGTNRLILPERPRKKFKLPSMPAMPSMAMPLIRIRLPRFRMPAIVASLIAMPHAVAVARMCVGLGVSLSIAMPFWPYPRTGLWWMLFYLFAVGMVLVSGVWSAKITWATRLGYSHVVALSIVLWGLMLMTEETVRNGYFTAEASGLW